jgi:hypothetical protein
MGGLKNGYKVRTDTGPSQYTNLLALVRGFYVGYTTIYYAVCQQSTGRPVSQLGKHSPIG